MRRFMTNSTARELALILGIAVTAAAGAAGCGSSSSTKTNASTPRTQSSPSTPQTQTTTSTPTTVASINPNAVPPSTAISSPAYRAVLVYSFKHAGFSQSRATFAADCLVKGFERIGAKTSGDLKRVEAQAASVVVSCVQKAQAH